MAPTDKEQKPKPLSDKEQELSKCLIMSLNGDFASISSMINWKKVAKLYHYKDEEIAKHQGRKLIKKIAELGKYDDEATGGDDNEAGESSTTAPKATTGKKRKASGTPQAENSSTKVAQRGRPSKKAKAACVNVKVEDHLSEAETSTEQQDEEEAD